MTSVELDREPTLGLPGHLDYYLRHRINPVRYEMNDLREHYDRRGSLYRMLGVIPRLVHQASVLEVAPGSGQNSLYLASLNPRELVLVEPNPTAQRDIRNLYATPGISPIQPHLVESTFQDYRSAESFDVVVCENWLGHSRSERALLRKLGGLVAADGVLVVTVISPTGILPNVMRKALACRIDRPDASFEERTCIQEAAFGSHLSTIPAMTRSARDWVRDNVMNPAYFGILLTIPMVVEDLGRRFDVLGSSPRFAADWRWFKALTGEAMEFNRHFLGEYEATLHNLLDYRAAPTQRDASRNRQLEQLAWEVGQQVCRMEQARAFRQSSNSAYWRDVATTIERLIDNVADLYGDCVQAMGEFLELFERDWVTAEQVARMRWFGEWFGRETIYLSLEKTRPSA